MNAIDTAQLKEQVNLVDLASQSTQLRKEASQEWSGPCPKCGGEDRFHVQADWFFCRHCHERRGDAIEYVSWLHGVSFLDAVAMLNGGQVLPSVSPAPAPRPAHRKQKQHQAQPFRWKMWDGIAAPEFVERAHERLFDSADGEPGREYLLGRGIESHAWLQYGLGYVDRAPVKDERYSVPSIVMPWVVRGQLIGARFRFLQGIQDGMGADGKPRIEKNRSRKANNRDSFSGRLFGSQALLGCAEDLRTVLLVEGELNAISIWQVARWQGVDVLSTGSESQTLTDAIVGALKRWRSVIVWSDKPEIAKRATSTLQGALAIQSPQGADANDLLQQGKLAGFLAAARLKACQDDSERERLLWDLWDSAGGTPEGIDTGCASIVRRIADQLGRQAALVDTGGRWVAKNG